MNREQIYNALFAKLSAVSGISLSSRRPRLYNEVAASDMPALFTVELDETYTQNKGLWAVVRMNVEVLLYINTGNDPNVVPATVLNNLLDAIDVALQPDDIQENCLTLGGLVSHCWIKDKIMKSPGDLEGAGIAVIPIEILLPAPKNGF